MKKLLGIVVLGLLLSGSVYADPSKNLKKYKGSDGWREYVNDSRFYCAKEAGKADNDFSGRKIFETCLAIMTDKGRVKWENLVIFGK